MYLICITTIIAVFFNSYSFAQTAGSILQPRDFTAEELKEIIIDTSHNQFGEMIVIYSKIIRLNANEKLVSDTIEIGSDWYNTNGTIRNKHRLFINTGFEYNQTYMNNYESPDSNKLAIQRIVIDKVSVFTLSYYDNGLVARISFTDKDGLEYAIISDERGIIGEMEVYKNAKLVKSTKL